MICRYSMQKEISIAIDLKNRRNTSGLSSDDSEKFAKIIYLCLMRGDVHSSLLWLKKAIDEYYGHIEIYSHNFGDELISSSNLSAGIINVLNKSGYIRWVDLGEADESDIKSIPGVGKTEYNKISIELYNTIKKHTK